MAWKWKENTEDAKRWYRFNLKKKTHDKTLPKNCHSEPVQKQDFFTDQYPGPECGDGGLSVDLSVCPF
jgi:hypothetical protein